MRQKHYEEDRETWPAEQNYTVKGFPGIAFYAPLGWETEPDEDTEWSGCENRTGRVVMVMVGDDYHHKVDPEDISPLKRSAFCGECGQIGCHCDGYDGDD
jgi:hypothetical protein